MHKIHAYVLVATLLATLLPLGSQALGLSTLRTHALAARCLVSSTAVRPRAGACRMAARGLVSPTAIRPRAGACRMAGMWNSGLEFGKGQFRFYEDFETWAGGVVACSPNRPLSVRVGCENSRCGARQCRSWDRARLGPPGMRRPHLR